MLALVSAHPSPVLDAGMPGTADIRYGFEGGSAFRSPDGHLHLFTAERAGDPILVRMRLGHWSSTDDGFSWSRCSTLAESSADFTGADPRAAFWGPMPVFDDASDHWHLVYVAYRAKPNTPAAWYENHEGRIWLARSTQPGPLGFAGPYQDLHVLLEPGPDSQAWEGLQGVDSFFPFHTGSRWLGFYGSARTEEVPCRFWGVGLAEAPALAGPWSRLPSGNPIPLDPVFAENPVVTRLGSTWIALVDGGPANNAFGYSTSHDALHWSPARWLPLPAPWWTMMRTPLCLLPNSRGTLTLLFTALHPHPPHDFGAVGRAEFSLTS